MNDIKLLDTVALLKDTTIDSTVITRGAVGVVVEFLGDDVFEVEFCDAKGQTIATASLNADQLLALHPPQAVRNVA